MKPVKSATMKAEVSRKKIKEEPRELTVYERTMKERDGWPKIDVEVLERRHPWDGSGGKDGGHWLYSSDDLTIAKEMSAYERSMMERNDPTKYRTVYV